jgi:hypothetical protein
MRRIALHYPERRSGFDRRELGGWQRVLLAYRSRPALVAVVLVLVVLLGLADLLLTLRALGQGATEVNPVMARLFAAGPVTAGLIKMGITLAVAGGIWLTRSYRRALEASLVLLAAFLVLSGYHLVGMTLAG